MRIKEMLLLKDENHPVFTREVYLIPKNQEVRMYLKSSKGTVQFCFWLRRDDSIMNERWSWITGFDLGYHGSLPRYEGQPKMSSDCPHAPGGKDCYYDGTSLGATELAERTMEWGDFTWAWRRMEEYHVSHFGADE